MFSQFLTITVLITLRVFVTTASSDGTCRRSIKCSGLDEYCTTEWNSSPFCENCCAGGFVCIGGRCKRDNLGGSCLTDEDCKSHKWSTDLVACIEGKCQAQYNAGDYCKDSNECYGNMKCEKDVCVGKEEGEECELPMFSDRPFQGQTCKFGLYCSKEAKNGDVPVCMKAIEEGMDCERPLCAPGLYCSELTKKCQRLFASNEGQPCSEDDECVPSTICETSKDGKVCQKAPKISVQKCNKNEDCHNGFNCTCDEFTGENVCLDLSVPTHEINCKTAKMEAVDCWVQNQCVFYLKKTLIDDKTCAYKQCKAKTESYEKCHTCGWPHDYYGSCNAEILPCADFPWWGIALVAIGGVITLSSCALTIIVLLKRRQTDYIHIPVSPDLEEEIVDSSQQN